VAATRTEVPVEKTAASVSVISRADIEAKHYTTLDEALQSVPGLVVARNGTPGQATSVFLRGTESNHTLLTIDGRRAPSMLAGGYDWGNLALDNIERIEVVRSSNSALHGGDAIGGVVNLITRTGRGLKSPEHEVSFEGGSFNQFRESVASRGAIGRFDYSLGLSQFNAEYPRDNNSYRRTGVRTSLGWETTQEIYSDLKVAYSLSEGGSPGALPGVLTDHLERESVTVSPGITWEVSDVWQSKLFYTFDNQFQPSFDGGPDFGSLNRLNVAAHLVDWQNTFIVHDTWKLTAGTLWQDQAIDRTTTSLFGGEINQNLQALSGYAQSQWSPIEALAFINAIRFDAYSDYASAVTWRQGVSFRVPEAKTLLFANIARSVSPPTAQDLYFFGNPDLKPERALSWEAGIEQPLLDHQLSASITGFQHLYHDFIQTPIALANIPNASSEGIEFALRYTPNPYFSANASYTYLSAYDDIANVRLLRRPRHQLGLDTVIKPMDKLTLSSGLSWIVDRQDATFPPPDFTATNVAIDDYLLVRSTAAYRITPHVEVWVRAENMLDQQYEAVLGYPALRLGVYGGLRVQF